MSAATLPGFDDGPNSIKHITGGCSKTNIRKLAKRRGLKLVKDRLWTNVYYLEDAETGKTVSDPGNLKEMRRYLDHLH